MFLFFGNVNFKLCLLSDFVALPSKPGADHRQLGHCRPGAPGSHPCLRRRRGKGRFDRPRGIPAWCATTSSFFHNTRKLFRAEPIAAGLEGLKSTMAVDEPSHQVQIHGSLT